jgi:hypothetical protein
MFSPIIPAGFGASKTEVDNEAFYSAVSVASGSSMLNVEQKARF